MNYANTLESNGREVVVTLLPLSAVPGFNPMNPPQANAYAVPDEVQLGWVKVGDRFVEPPPVDPVVPASVTRAQLKLALLEAGWLDDVEAFIAAANDPVLTINWNERQEFERNHPLVIAVISAMGKTEAEGDAVFVSAKSK